MSKEYYFQYLQGENQGKIVKLEKIDDTLPDNNMYYFSDGLKCFSNLVGLWGDVNAYKSGKIISLIPNQDNKWKFQKNIIKQNDKKGYYEEQEFDIPDPYFVDKSGKQLHNSVLQKNIDAIPPIYRDHDKIEISEEYFISCANTHQDSDNTATVVSPKPEKNLQDLSSTPLTHTEYANTIIQPISRDLTVNLDEPDNEGIKISVIKDNQIIIASEYLYDIISDYILEDPEDVQNIQLTHSNSSNDISEPVKILVDSCKKKPQEIEMSLDIDLPNKTFYEMISENYGIEKSKECISYIIDNLDITLIKDALKNTLLEIYCSNSEE